MVSRRHPFALLALFVCAVCPVDRTAAQQAFELTDLGTLGGTTSTGVGINAAGQVVGSSTTAGDAATHAFLYKSGVMTDLGTLGGATSEARAINDAGTIVGTASTAANAGHAVLWANGSIMDLDPNGTTGSNGFDINNSGQVVGVTGSADPNNTYGVATLWSGGTVTTLMLDPDGSGSQAYGINDSGEIVGSVYYWAVMHDGAVVWPTSTGIDTPLFDGGYGGKAFAINSSNAIVGQGEFPSYEPTAWSSGGTLIGLSSLAGGESTSNESAAYGINASGEIVGTDDSTGTIRATLWPSSSAQAVDLNTTLRPSVASTVMLTDAFGINVNGLVVAFGILKATGDSHAFLLTPVAIPGTPTATLSASPSTVTIGQSYTLSWSSTNAWACMAGGSGPDGAPWSGLLATSGSQVIAAGASAGQLTATLSCSFGNQQSPLARSVVSVTPAGSAGGGGGGGGGTLDWMTLTVLAAMGVFNHAVRRRRWDDTLASPVVAD